MTDISSAKAKLAQSRAALLAAMGHRAPRAPYASAGARPESFGFVGEEVGSEPPGMAARLEAKVERSVLGRWWRRSHLSTVAELGTPFLQSYASKHPAKLMAYAAGVGSLVVLVKPWRLLSLGMVVGLLVRSTDVAGLVSSYLVPQLGDTDSPRDDFLERPPG